MSLTPYVMKGIFPKKLERKKKKPGGTHICVQ